MEGFGKSLSNVNFSSRDAQVSLFNFMLCAALGITLLVTSSNYADSYCGKGPSPDKAHCSEQLSVRPLYQCTMAVGITSLVLAFLSLLSLPMQNRKLVEQLSSAAYIGLGVPLVVISANYCKFNFPEESPDGQLCLTAVVVGSIFLFFAALRFLGSLFKVKKYKSSSRR